MLKDACPCYLHPVEAIIHMHATVAYLFQLNAKLSI